MHGKIAPSLLFQKHYDFQLNTLFLTEIFDDFHWKYAFFIENWKCFSFFLRIHFFNRATQISRSWLVRYRSFCFCLKEHVKTQGLKDSFF